MIIFVNASNIHTGGGKVILNDFICATKYFDQINFKIYVDSRYNSTEFERSNVSFNITIILSANQKVNLFLLFLAYFLKETLPLNLP